MASKARATDRKYFGLPIYEIGGKQYAVGTDDEADKAARQAVELSLWATSTASVINFVARYRIDLTHKDFDRLKRGIEIAQTKAGEDANDLIQGLIGEKYLPKLCEELIRVEGRGRLLSPQDGSELDSGRVSGLPKGKFAYRL